MVPPDDKAQKHDCAWREFATHLQGEVEGLKAQVEVLTRAFAKRSEKTGKMPKIPRPPKTPEEAADRRTEQALLRTERVVTEEKRAAVPEAEKKCRVCGGSSFRSVGAGKTCEIFEYVPGYLKRIVLTRETVACRCGGCVITAPAPDRWADKTRYASSFVAHLVVSKCLAATPHYRLEQTFARTGVSIARSTINDLFRRAGQKLEPLRAPLFDEIRKDFLVHADETSFKMTQQKSKSFIWAFVGQTLTGYRFDLSRSGDVPVDVLKDSVGAILCDDYRGYDPLVRKGKRRRCGCLAHYLERIVIRSTYSAVRSFGRRGHRQTPGNDRARRVSLHSCHRQSIGRASALDGESVVGPSRRPRCISRGRGVSSTTAHSAASILSHT